MPDRSNTQILLINIVFETHAGNLYDIYGMVYIIYMMYIEFMQVFESNTICVYIDTTCTVQYVQRKI